MNIEQIAEINPDAIVLDGFNDAIIGMAERINFGPLVAYDAEKIISIMVERDGMTDEDAREYFEYNISGSYLGEYSPIFINTK